MRVIIDVMGGDNAPDEILKGVFSAADETDVEFVLVGNEKSILQYIYQKWCCRYGA